jgi:hypothetical protein
MEQLVRAAFLLVDNVPTVFLAQVVYQAQPEI